VARQRQQLPSLHGGDLRHHGLQPECVQAPARRLARQLPPLLLPGGIGVEREHQFPHLTRPGPAPALHAEERHHARHARRQQRQGITGALAHPQGRSAGPQRGGVKVACAPGSRGAFPQRLGKTAARARQTAAVSAT
jgi:hypothetical protein